LKYELHLARLICSDLGSILFYPSWQIILVATRFWQIQPLAAVVKDIREAAEELASFWSK